MVAIKKKNERTGQNKSANKLNCVISNKMFAKRICDQNCQKIKILKNCMAYFKDYIMLEP